METLKALLFNAYLDETYGGCEIGNYRYCASTILKSVDHHRYNVEMNRWLKKSKEKKLYEAINGIHIVHHKRKNRHHSKGVFRL